MRHPSPPNQQRQQHQLLKLRRKLVNNRLRVIRQRIVGLNAERRATMTTILTRTALENPNTSFLLALLIRMTNLSGIIPTSSYQLFWIIGKLA
jgi:hypothetical protein